MRSLLIVVLCYAAAPHSFVSEFFLSVQGICAAMMMKGSFGMQEIDRYRARERPRTPYEIICRIFTQAFGQQKSNKHSKTVVK